MAGLRSVVFALIVVAYSFMLPGCGQSKPQATDYAGHWNGGRCSLHIAVVGASLVAKAEDDAGAGCREYEQVYSLGEDGSAKGGPMGAITLLLDKKANSLIVNGPGILGNMNRDDQYHAIKDGFDGTWRVAPKNEGLMNDVLIIELTDGQFRVREQEQMDNKEFRNVRYEPNKITGILEMTVDSTYRTPFSIVRNTDGNLLYSDQRGGQSLKKQ